MKKIAMNKCLEFSMTINCNNYIKHAKPYEKNYERTMKLFAKDQNVEKLSYH